MSETKLRPCPWCGGEGFIRDYTRLKSRPSVIDFWVACSACFVTCRHASSEAAAVANWNTRAHDIALVESLTGCLQVIEVGLSTGTFELLGSLADIPAKARKVLDEVRA